MQTQKRSIFRPLKPALSKLVGKIKLSFSIDNPCLLCDDLNKYRICNDCKKDYLIRPQYSCRRCGIPLSVHALICGECLKSSPHFDETMSIYLYQRPLDQLINNFKHKSDFIAGKALSQLFSLEIENYYRQHHLTLPDMLVAVPLHWHRQWHRGFNQSAYFTHTLSKDLGMDEFRHVRRIQATKAQELLSRKQRLSNIGKSFKVTKELKGESIAIIDDVMTTGSTVNSLAKALKQSGAGRIVVWALARTPKSKIK